MKHRALAIGVSLLGLTGVLLAQQPAAAPKPLHFGAWGVDLTGMDKNVNPGDDFDRYVNGAWRDRTEIPADQRSAGVGADVFNLTQDQIRSIIETAPPSS